MVKWLAPSLPPTIWSTFSGLELPFPFISESWVDGCLRPGVAWLSTSHWARPTWKKVSVDAPPRCALLQLSSPVAGREAGVPGWSCGRARPLGQPLAKAGGAELGSSSRSHPHEVGPALVVCCFQSVAHVILCDLG